MARGRTLVRFAGVVILPAVMMLAAAEAQAGEWLTDARSLCQIWDPNPQVGESVTWLGACANGRAEGSGTAQWRKGGTVIETDKGEWRDGRQAGNGVQTWSTGSYQGELAGGQPNGRGVLTLQNLRYEGQFQDGKPNGTGSLSQGSKSVQGTWKDGCLQGGKRKASIGIPLSLCP